MVVPIAFFPHWLGSVARALPFASALQTPVDVWLGQYAPWRIPLQAAWAIALFLLGRVVLRRAAQKLVVQGG
jgi:ABC-2 type transport system permease protein